MTVSLASLVSAIPMAAAVDMSAHFSGSRLWTGFDHQGESIWIADLPRLTASNVYSLRTKAPASVDVLPNNLFISADRRVFHQLRDVERQEQAVLTDTPGFVALMFVYGETGARLLYDKPLYRNPRMVQMELSRESVGATFTNGIFHLLGGS